MTEDLFMAPGADNVAALRQRYEKKDLLAAAKARAREMIARALAAAAAAGELPDAEAAPFVVEVPADVAHGDLAANTAMVSARAFRKAPRAIAEAIVRHLPEDPLFSGVEIAGPGFINFFLSQRYFGAVVAAAALLGDEYGRTAGGAGEKVNVEFVSANPTGPMHLGNARGGVLGDCLAACFDWAGYDVTREFYINDAGNQIAKFGRSLVARYLQLVKGEEAVDFPEDGYQGDDIRERAEQFLAAEGPAWADKPQEELEAALVAYALPRNIAGMREGLEKYRVGYDVWFSESTLHDSGAVEAVVQKLVQRGAAYEKDGVVWYRATAHGGEKDEVLVRANGVPTYFAADIAYHADKFDRGFRLAVDVWGADHHGHVARMKGAMDALGYNGDALDIVLMQFVSLVREGKPVRMSKRTGKAITLTDLLEEVSIDSARFFFNLREPGSQIEFDLDLAVAEDSDNPVYYVQYAHARICSLVRTLEGDGVSFRPEAAMQALPLLEAEVERALIRRVAAFPGEIASAAAGRDPARINRFLIDAATDFHRFYTNCRIRGEEADLQQARLALALAAKTVLANGLALLKVTAPEQM